MANYLDTMFSNFPDVVDVAQMCDMLGGICKKTGCKLLKENKIKHFKIGRKYFIPKVHILQYLEVLDETMK